MHVREPADETDCYWEDDAPRFRVYLFRGPGPGYSVETYDISDADVGEVMTWAQNEAAPDRQWAVTLVRDTQPDGTPSRGLVWLIGRDLNEVPPGRAGHDHPFWLTLRTAGGT